MSLTPSTMVQLGTQAPNFLLRDVISDKTISLKTFEKKRALLVMFICRHCPYVQHIQQGLARLGRDYEDKNIGMVAISSNDAVNYPEDGPEHLKQMSQELKFTFPYCYDESQDVARSYSAACTPDFFLFDAKRVLVYRGQMDDSRPGNGKPVTGKDLRAAIDAVLADIVIDQNQKPSIGCNIKWKEN